MLKADVAIVTMVYISRLHNAGLVLQPGNWKRVVLGSVMMASKVWTDRPVLHSWVCVLLVGLDLCVLLCVYVLLSLVMTVLLTVMLS